MADKDRLATQRALRQGADMLRAEGHEAVTLAAVIWRLLQDASDTLSRLPDNDRRYLLAADKVAWPEVVHTYEERLAEENQRLEERRQTERAGFTPEETPWRGRGPVMDPTAIPRMFTVMGWLMHVKARTPIRCKRDKLVALAMAQGQPMRVVRRLMLGDKSDSAARMVKLKVIKHVSQALVVRGYACELTEAVANCVNSITQSRQLSPERGEPRVGLSAMGDPEHGTGDLPLRIPTLSVTG